MPSFDSARVKLRSAEHHLDALKAQVQVVKEGDLAQLAHEYDPDARQNLWRWQGVAEDTSTKLSPIIGDVLTNSFACLEHIMYAFLSNTIPDRDIYWPVSVKANDWGSAKGRHKGLPSLALDIIEDYQPSERPDSFDAALMFVLRELVNIDKHRRLVVVGLPVRGAATSREYAHDITFNFSDPAKSGAVFASLDGDKVDVKIDPTLDIGFDEAGWLRRKPILEVIPLIVSTAQTQ